MVKIGGAQQQQDQAFGLSDLDLDDDQLTTMSDKSDEIDEKVICFVKKLNCSLFSTEIIIYFTSKFT